MKEIKIEKRRDLILDLLGKYDSLRVSQLVNKLEVSDETIRNDLKVLSKQGLITRQYGTASLSKKTVEEKTKLKKAENRVSIESDVKNELAELAVSLIHQKENITIALDQGSTIAQIAKILSKFNNCNIFTSSLLALENLKNSNSNIYCLGGKYNREDSSFQNTGIGLNQNVIHYDYSFIGSSGVLDRDGICSTSFADAQMKQNMINQSTVSICVIDSQKFTQTSLLKVADWSKLDYVVTNLSPESEDYKNLKEQTKVITTMEK